MSQSAEALTSVHYIPAPSRSLQHLQNSPLGPLIPCGLPRAPYPSRTIRRVGSVSFLPMFLEILRADVWLKIMSRKRGGQVEGELSRVPT